MGVAVSCSGHLHGSIATLPNVELQHGFASACIVLFCLLLLRQKSSSLPRAVIVLPTAFWAPAMLLEGVVMLCLPPNENELRVIVLFCNEKAEPLKRAAL